MLDRERILARLDALERSERELRQLLPTNVEEYLAHFETRRACERILQIGVESIIDVCHLFVAGLRLGLPAEEDDLFEKLHAARILPSEMVPTMRTMKGFRNILVHEYGEVDDRIVFRTAGESLRDFPAFRHEALDALRNRPTV